MFEFNIGDQVAIRRSGEAGEVIGRSEYRDAAPQYLVEYTAADGRFVQGDFFASQIIAA